MASRLYSRARDLLADHGAEEVKTLGDGIVLRCGDAAAAIALGLRLVRECEAEPGFPPLRAGIHSGSAVRRDGEWYGRALNVASRLCSVAGGGEVLVSDAALGEAGDLRKVELGDRRLHWLRNVTEPVAARLVSVRHCGRGRLRITPPLALFARRTA